MQEYQQRSAAILKRAEEDCVPIDDEEAATLTRMSGVSTKTNLPRSTQEQRAATRAEFDQKKAAIREAARNESNKILEQGRHDCLTIEQSAINLDNQLIRSEQGAPGLVPNGTTLYIRNYMTPSEPSGAAVPLAAPASRSLKTK